MIEALIAQLGPEKEEERAKAVAERKAEETEFLATATPKEKGRMRGGRGGVSALVRGGGRGRMEEREVVGPGGRGGGRGRGRPNEFLFTATERQRGLHVARGGHGVRDNTGGRTSAPGPSNIARFFPTADGNRIAERGTLATAPSGRAAMARAGSNEGAGGSGMAGALARVWARRQDERAGGQWAAGGQGRGGQGVARGHHRGGGRGGGRRGGAGGHRVGSGGGDEQMVAEGGGNRNRSATIEISSDDSEVGDG